jgi:hypothetical protein
LINHPLPLPPPLPPGTLKMFSHISAGWTCFSDIFIKHWTEYKDHARAHRGNIRQHRRRRRHPLLSCSCCCHRCANFLVFGLFCRFLPLLVGGSFWRFRIAMRQRQMIGRKGRKEPRYRLERKLTLIPRIRRNKRASAASDSRVSDVVLFVVDGKRVFKKQQTCEQNEETRRSETEEFSRKRDPSGPALITCRVHLVCSDWPMGLFTWRRIPCVESLD